MAVLSLAILLPAYGVNAAAGMPAHGAHVVAFGYGGLPVDELVQQPSLTRC
jgi:hypothetical protein